MSIIIPTVAGREEYLDRCIEAYEQRTPGDNEIIVIHDSPSCGLAWQEGSYLAHCEYLHLTADDILPDHGWFEAMKAVVDAGAVPAGLVLIPTPECLDENQWPKPGVVAAREQFFERSSSRSEVPDGYVGQGESEYPAIPFCAWGQWTKIGPMIASHYGTDKWFGHRAKAAGYPVIATHGARFWHYAALPGRKPPFPGWLHTDRIDFDMNVEYPLYVSGALWPDQRHPQWNTTEGRNMARAWRVAHVPGPHPWENAGEEYQ